MQEEEESDDAIAQLNAAQDATHAEADALGAGAVEGSRAGAQGAACAGEGLGSGGAPKPVHGPACQMEGTTKRNRLPSSQVSFKTLLVSELCNGIGTCFRTSEY